VPQNTEFSRQSPIFLSEGRQNENFSGIAHSAMKEFRFEDAQKRKHS
jgi:hypothetical protein